VRVKAQHDLSELQPITVSQITSAIAGGELFIVENNGIRARQVGDGPPTVRIAETGVPAAYRARPERDVLYGVAGISPDDQFSWPARDANEADLFVLGIAGDDLEAAGQ
jgi:hypothetical protein